MENIVNPPAIIRPADDLVQLAARINAAHQAGEKAVRRGLEHYRAAGEMLLQAKAKCRGNWLKWLKGNVAFSDVTAGKYMKIAAGWPKIAGAATQGEALDQLNSERSKSEPPSDFNQSTIDTPPEPNSEIEEEEGEEESSKPHVAQNTGEHEWYTPPAYLEAARAVLGTIELDPASSDIAQRTVQATVYHTKETNGLAQHWSGKTWMNPPYQAGLIDQFTAKLCGHVEAGDVPEAIVLVNNATETEWFQTLAAKTSSICFPAKRVRFLDPEGNPGAPLQGQAVLYLGENVDQFAREFVQFGLILRK